MSQLEHLDDDRVQTPGSVENLTLLESDASESSPGRRRAKAAHISGAMGGGSETTPLHKVAQQRGGDGADAAVEAHVPAAYSGQMPSGESPVAWAVQLEVEFRRGGGTGIVGNWTVSCLTGGCAKTGIHSGFSDREIVPVTSDKSRRQMGHKRQSTMAALFGSLKA
jgi:hypothetical protein